jgi:hypothetical protein
MKQSQPEQMKIDLLCKLTQRYLITVETYCDCLKLLGHELLAMTVVC